MAKKNPVLTRRIGKTTGEKARDEYMKRISLPKRKK